MTLAHIPTAEAVEDYEDIEENPIDIAITNISEDMKKCYSLSITVKWFSFIDFLFSTLLAFGNMYFFIPVLLSFSGYWGAKTFDKKYIFIYFLYVLVNNIWRLTLFIDLFSTADPNTKDDYTVNFILIIFCSSLGLWIARIIYKFYEIMKSLTDLELDILRNIRNRRAYYVILW